MFVQWIVIPNFADCFCGKLPSISGHSSWVDSSRILRLFLDPERSIAEKPGPEPESVIFLAVTGVCTVFTNVIASVQNKYFWIAVASTFAQRLNRSRILRFLKFRTQVRIQKLWNRSGVWKCDSGWEATSVAYSWLLSLVCRWSAKFFVWLPD